MTATNNSKKSTMHANAEKMSKKTKKICSGAVMTMISTMRQTMRRRNRKIGLTTKYAGRSADGKLGIYCLWGSLLRD